MFAIEKCLLFLVLFTHSNASIWKLPTIPENQTNVLESWMEMDKNFKGATKTIIKTLLPMVLEYTSHLNLSSKCQTQSFQLAAGLQNLKKWAFSFLDSSTKLENGIMKGTISFLGDYEQCMDISVPHPKIKDRIQFEGQYCKLEVTPVLPPKTSRYRYKDHLEESKNFTGTEIMSYLISYSHYFYRAKLTFGLCIPSGCSENDLNQVLSFGAKKISLNIEAAHCELKRKQVEFSVGQVIAIVVCSLLASIVLLGTLLEMRSKSRNITYNQLGYQIFLSFSIITNFKKLTSIKTPKESFNCLHGIRFLSCTWIILFHTHFFPALFFHLYRNPLQLYSYTSQFFSQMIFNATECNDTFLFMGGFLLCYFTVKKMKLQKKKFNLMSFTIHRIWRIAPAYYFVLLCGLLVPLMGSGPVFGDIMQDSVYPCFQYWWRNALFINNFFDMKDICMLHTWYVSCDMQLYLASIVVVLALIRSKRIGTIISILIIFASIAYSGTVSYINDLAPTETSAYPDHDDARLLFLYTYSNPLSRAGAYVIGILLGYRLATNPDIKISKNILVVGWCFATLLSGTVVFMSASWFKREVSTPELVIYAAFYKVAFTLGIAWMTLCCVTGNGGIINGFLSWKLWVPLSKLSFLIYLIHPYIIHSYMANFQTVRYGSRLDSVLQFFGYLCISGLLALIASLLVESPFQALEKVIFSREDKAKKVEVERKCAPQNDKGMMDVDGKSDKPKYTNGIYIETFDSKV